MQEGPFGGPRPFGIGPLTSEETNEEKDKNQETEETDDINLEEIDDKTVRATLKMANDWYESITKDQSKHNMMRNYLRKVTELSDDEIDDILNKAGI